MEEGDKASGCAGSRGAVGLQAGVGDPVVPPMGTPSSHALLAAAWVGGMEQGRGSVAEPRRKRYTPSWGWGFKP